MELFNLLNLILAIIVILIVAVSGIWRAFRKKTKLVEEAFNAQKELCREINADKLVLEGELIKRTKQLHDLENELIRAKRLSVSKDEFIRVTSHELRTPMDVIRGNLDMVLKGEVGELPPKVKEYLRDALLGSDRLAGIVNEMLDISRIETGALKFDFKEFDVKELIDSLAKDFGPLVEKKNLKLELNIKSGLPKVFADLGKVFQVFDNLIGNAIKFTPEGLITITIYQENDFVITELKDTGIGIAKEDQAKVFQKFPQIEKEMMEPEAIEKGTGLGLYISHELVNKMGGKIWAESEGRSKGSKFSFSLPAAKSPKAREIARLYKVEY